MNKAAAHASIWFQFSHGGSTAGVIIVFDLTDPLNANPVRFQPLTHGTDNLGGVTQRPDGSCLTWTNGDENGLNDVRVCNMAAANAVCESPTGELILSRNSWIESCLSTLNPWRHRHSIFWLPL